MITVYERHGTSIQGRTLEPGEGIPAGVVWIDMLSPEPHELDLIETQLGAQIPAKKEIWKNQVLNRLYIEDNIAYMTAALITKVDSPYPGTAAVTFILAPSYLLTVHEIAPTSFRNFAERLARGTERFPHATHVFEGLLEEMIVRVAYNSEIVVDTLDQLSHDIFGGNVFEENTKNSTQLMKIVLKRLGAAADLNSKINESLQSINRLLLFFKKIVPTEADVDLNIDILMSDTSALMTQTAFLSDKVTFQLDATLGMINVEQNLIMKIFSVFTIFFLPPTLIGSLYGMNFQHMPELSWPYGYPMAIALMLLAAFAPFVYFRRKRWL